MLPHKESTGVLPRRFPIMVSLVNKIDGEMAAGAQTAMRWLQRNTVLYEQ